MRQHRLRPDPEPHTSDYDVRFEAIERSMAVISAGLRTRSTSDWTAAVRKSPENVFAVTDLSIIEQATGGQDPSLVIAALLHDTIEDQQVPREMIAASFGEDVAALVQEVTDVVGPSLLRR